MNPELMNHLDWSAKINTYALRYEWLRTHGSCPFAETDAAWDTPELFDKAVDAALRAQVKQRI
jgi:hypothetical protein